MSKFVTIDEALAVLTKAKEQIGGDKTLILSLTNSELHDVNVNELVIIHDEDSRFVEVRVLHDALDVTNPDNFPDEDTPLAPAPELNVNVALFLSAEIRNENDGGDSPTTFGTANDSLRQMDDETLAGIIKEPLDSPEIDVVREQLKQLTEQYGYNFPARKATCNGRTLPVTN